MNSAPISVRRTGIVTFKNLLIQEVLGRTNRLISFRTTRTARRVQQLFYCCVCIRCRRNVYSEPLSSNDLEDKHTDRLMGGIYGLRCHDIHTKFCKDRFRHSQIIRGGYTDTQTGWISHKPTFIFFKTRKAC
jgi:hypothetical protein